MDTPVTIDDLTGDFRKIAELIGIDAALLIITAFSGMTIYVPNLSHFQRKRRDDLIRQDRDGGTSIRKLARKYALTEVQIYTILGRS
jgi:Mor family transcriptional regulator